MLPEGIDFYGGIDISGNMKSLFATPTQVPGCVFLLCIRGNCRVKIHLNEYELNKNSLAIILPKDFFQIQQQSPDCRFIFIAFSTDLIYDSRIFSYTIDLATYIHEQPIHHFKEEIANLLKDYFLIIIKSRNMAENALNKSHSYITFIQLSIGLRDLYKKKHEVTRERTRNHEIITELLRLIIQHYAKERHITFYADKLHVSVQHLSTILKRTTGKTLTDIISTFIINDAKAKLCSTEMTIQEIAYSLNFPDTSFFGKYFKRYTGMPPKQFRKSEQ